MAKENARTTKIYADDLELLKKYSEANGMSNADLINRILRSERLKTQEALKKFTEENLKEKMRGLGLR